MLCATRATIKEVMSTPPKKKYFCTFNDKWCEDEEFGFGKVDSFTVKFILLLEFSSCHIWRQAWTNVSCCQQEMQGFGQAFSENTRFKQKATTKNTTEKKKRKQLHCGCVCHVKNKNTVIELLVFCLVLWFCGAEQTAPVKCTLYTSFNLLQYSPLSAKGFSLPQC